MADINAIAKQFTDFYYTTFDTDRSQLQSLYRDESMLTYEATQHRGAAIVEHLISLPFSVIRHTVTTLDAQPASATMASMIVMVTGGLFVDEGEHPIQFSQVFHLLPEGGTYYVFNDIFRLNYG